MLNGKPYAVSTFFRLKEISFKPDFSDDANHERWLPATMEAEIEMVPFGITQSFNKNPTLRASIKIPEHIRRVLEEALDLELRDFVRFQNKERGPRSVVRVIPRGPEGHGGFSRTMPEETAHEVAAILRDVYFEKYEVKVEEDPETTKKGDDDAHPDDNR